MSGDIHTLGVVDIASAVARGELSPVEVAEAFLARIDALEPKVQAWSYLDREDVRKQAAALADQQPAGPLHGVPIGIKDEFHVKGMPTGMRGRGTTAPELEDSTPVARLRAAGAIILGKTWMPVDGDNPPTRNPWNLGHTPGGSSSGSGAAVAAGMAPIALAEQTGGSTIRPASYCGVAGFKPSFGRVSRFGCYPFSYSFDHPGLIGQTLEDIALVLSVIAGPDSRDLTTINEPPPPASLDRDGFRPPRIGVVRNIYPGKTGADMLRVIENSADRFAKAGATVVDVLLPDDFSLLWPVHRLVGGVEGAAFHGSRVGESPDIGQIRRHVLPGLIPGTYYLQAQRVRGWVAGQMEDMLRRERVDLLLMAPVPGPAPEGLKSTGPPELMQPWATLGWPAMTINGGMSSNGLPLGIQVVAGFGMDWNLMRAGAWGQQVLGRPNPPPLS